MTVTSWLRLTISLWLLRKAVKGTGWVLLFLVLVAVWPVTVVAILGYLAASRRGWPPARLRRAAVATVALTGLYAAGEVVAPARRAGRRAGPGPGLGGRLAPARPGRGADVRAGVPGRGPGRAGPGRRAVVLAELRDQRRDRRPDGLGPGHLRRPPVEDGRSPPPPAAPPRPATSPC